MYAGDKEVIPFYIVYKNGTLGLNGKQGLIDRLGREILAPEFEYVFVLSDYHAIAQEVTLMSITKTFRISAKGCSWSETRF
jgi:hypothetical protein